ncbi:MAG: glycogen/starch/alpha-glucan phosphorylase [Opitutae bacterium]|jgi:glycogen phosphorylase|nr:glycogen/starch/alpha-glucan phosphorylase [Opitutae bacterium]MBT5717698.1 glycogen/starch/alpha-glucan phosphorylase [Opitutae bacterium]
MTQNSLSRSNPIHVNKSEPDLVVDVKKAIKHQLRLILARDLGSATKSELWMATSLAVREMMIDRFIETQKEHSKQDTRRVYYLSLEYLMGRLLNVNLSNLGLKGAVEKALSELGFEFDVLCEEEHDMGLGNGGLGRLAACFLDSMATMDLPAVGYGIHYQFGLFKQEFENGRQIEKPDDWLKNGNPWEIVRPQYAQKIHLYGRVEHGYDDLGNYSPQWVDTKEVEGIPYDLPIVGYGAKTVNFLRLWESKASEQLDFQIFNQGGYVEAVREKAMGETISKVLYPNDETESGKELRLVQQYFFVSCSLQDIIRRFQKKERSWDEFPKQAVIQLNDTHPAVAILEMMRIFLDIEHLSWDFSWALVQRTFAYTNHTLLPEALETWSEGLFAKVLPRHLDIVREINRRFVEKEIAVKWPSDNEKHHRMAILADGQIRMAFLSVVGSHSVNGVAALHTKLLKERLLKDFAELYPDRFNNKTNGITPRRWLLSCNQELSELVTSVVGDGWVTHLSMLRGLEKVADDPSFQQKFLDIKKECKVSLAQVIQEKMGLTIPIDAIYDAQIKRLHEYKRQHLNLLHILTLYRRLLQNPDLDIPARVFIFGAKAAPGYHLAKVIIHAINLVGERINQDARIKDKLKVAYLPNYGVSLAEKIIPATDLSEQISTAGKEASGTGNMKFALNGAVTMGTLDGANVEILEEVGDENIFIFGQTVDGIEELKKSGYEPRKYYEEDDELKAVLDWLSSDFFSPDEGCVLSELPNSLLEWGDPFFVLADYRAYVDAQDLAGKAYQDQSRWAAMAIRNIAGSGKFSSDRTIGEYAEDVWQLKPVSVPFND